MSLPYLKITDIEISFGGPTLLSSINCQITADDKICLVGKNGSGKSTLMKIIKGELIPDTGEVFIMPGIKIGYLPQNIVFKENQTIYDYVLEDISLDEDETKEHKKYLADIIVEKLKIDGHKLMSKCSGGKLRRASLAKTLVEEPELLLLDEPTNHLDIDSVEWLEDYLKKFKGGLLFISHDRAFLKNISNKTFWIDRGNLLINDNGYKNFENWSNQMFEAEKKELEKISKKLEQENIWLNQGISARRKRNQQRLENLYKLREKLKLNKSRLKYVQSALKLEPLNPDLAAKLVLEIDNVSFEYQDVDPPKKIIKPFSLRLLQGERVGIMGRNGSGKTTLIKLITGEIQPTTGKIKLGPNINISYFSQHREILNDKKTLWETLCPDGGDIVKVSNKFRHVVGYLKDFLFLPDQVKSPVGTLSGGEKNRLLLAKILANPGNFLILDEPTNDLDMDTLDMLHDILDDFKGTMIIISHDRDFLERIASRTIIFDGEGKIEDFIGGYYDYRKLQLKNQKNKINKNNQILKENKEEIIKKTKPTVKLTYKLQRELELLPEQISHILAEIKDIEKLLSEPDFFSKDPELFIEKSNKLVNKKQQLDNMEIRWLELEEMSNQNKEN